MGSGTLRMGPEVRATGVCRRRMLVRSVKGMRATGWCHDPYGLHDDRWFDDGQATSRVRDGGTESYDPTPGGPPPAFFRGYPVYPTRVGWLRRRRVRRAVLLPGLLALGVLSYFWSLALIPALFILVLLVAGSDRGRRRAYGPWT